MTTPASPLKTFKELFDASPDHGVALDLALPAAGGGVVDELLFDVETGAEARRVVAGGEELRAGQHQVALARPFGWGAQAVAEFELGLEEIGLQPGHRLGIEAMFPQGFGGGAGECQLSPRWRARASWYCCLTVGSDSVE